MSGAPLNSQPVNRAPAVSPTDRWSSTITSSAPTTTHTAAAAATDVGDPPCSCIDDGRGHRQHSDSAERSTDRFSQRPHRRRQRPEPQEPVPTPRHGRTELRLSAGLRGELQRRQPVHPRSPPTARPVVSSHGVAHHTLIAYDCTIPGQSAQGSYASSTLSGFSSRRQQPKSTSSAASEIVDLEKAGLLQDRPVQQPEDAADLELGSDLLQERRPCPVRQRSRRCQRRRQGPEREPLSGDGSEPRSGGTPLGS